MTKYVIGPDVALRLAQEDAVIADEHKLLARFFARNCYRCSTRRSAAER
jgi:hypothetical protein